MFKDASMYRFEENFRSQHIILDCDDVVLDWMSGFQAHVRRVTGIIPDPAGPTTWEMGEWLGIQDEVILELIRGFNGSPAFGHLDARYDALMALPALHRMGHKLTVLTSCSADEEIVRRRRENLEAHFGDIFQQVICIPLRESKRKWLNILERGIWVEDNYKNATLGHGCGHRTFMVRRRHNRSHETPGDPIVTWVDDLRSIVSLFN
ncbi:hypothetical protein [Rhizobium wenxiniae]|uniref:hypothetical protein n=1 Tax=Rhizobium wenxiniae TaxID=1737357 RepID=UPI003C2229F5